METKELLTIVGWPVTFFLGMLSGVITKKLTSTKSKLSWEVENYSNILSKSVMQNISAGFNVPIKITLNGEEEKDLSILTINIGNTGNIELKNLKVFFYFGAGANLFLGKFIEELGAYKEHLKLEKEKERAILTIGHINVKQAIGIEFLVGNLNMDHFKVDMAEPGVKLIKTQSLNFELSTNFIKSIGFGVMGLKIDPVASQLGALIEEVKKIRLKSGGL